LPRRDADSGFSARGTTDLPDRLRRPGLRPRRLAGLAAFLKQYPTLLDSGTVTDSVGFVFVDRDKFREIFAADVERTEARVMAATQKPIFGAIFGQSTAAAAWKNIPSWYLVTTKDHAINPDLERLYAKRIGATTVEVASSHAVFVAHPHAVVKLIEQAAQAVR
jgi:pimeloyl-ACP methyl ester carboxylesterase